MAESSIGTDYVPTLVYNEKMARSIFGEGRLIDRFLDAIAQTDAIEVYLVKIQPHAFQTAWNAIAPFDFDLVYVDDFSFGESVDDILSFIDLAQSKAEQGRLIHGFFDLEQCNTLQELEPIFNLIESFTHENTTDVYEMGKYLSVIMDQFADRKAGVMYAAQLASSQPEISPVNKTFNATLAFEFEKDELRKIKESGIVVFKNSYHNGVVPVTATAAVSTPGSVHKNITNFRIVQYLVNEAYDNINQFIGQTGVRFHELEIASIIEDLLYTYINLGRIKDFDYSVQSDKLNGFIYLNMEVVPIFTVEKITTHTQVRIFK